MRGQMTCNGCGARCEIKHKPGDRSKAEIFHPDPLCSHVLGLIAEGVAEGPIVRASRDLLTGEVVEEPHARDN